MITRGKIPTKHFWLFDIIILTVSFFPCIYLLLHAPSFFKTLFPPTSALYPFIDHVMPWFNPKRHLLDQVWVFMTMTPVILICMELLGGYRPLLGQSYTRIIVNSFIAPAIGLGIISITMVATKDPDFSRLIIFSFAGCSALGLGAYRIAMRIYFRRRQAAGCYAKNVALIGLPAGLDFMVQHLCKDLFAINYRLLGYLSLPSDYFSPALNSWRRHHSEKLGNTAAAAVSQKGMAYASQIFLCGNQRQQQHVVNFSQGQLKPLGNVGELGELLIHHPIQEVIVIYPMEGGDWLPKVISDCHNFGTNLRIIPEALLTKKLLELKSFVNLDDLQLPSVVLKPRYADSDALFFKRLFDILFSGITLVILTPLFLLIALAIKITTPNLPVFYPWRVVGRNGVRFTGYKFTTMVADADYLKDKLQDRNEMSGPVFKIKDDPRITPLGRFLRKFSLNELPQFWSVLKGDMSLVGPRPAGPNELERYEFWHKRKLSLWPGITCLWQIRGRNKISNFDDWVKMDLEYIDNWSLWLDFKILARTIWVVLKGTGS